MSKTIPGVAAKRGEPSPKPRGYTKVVPAADEACRTLFYLASQGGEGVALTRICAEVGLAKSKGFTILATLASHGLVVKDEATKCYSLGPAVLELSHSFLEKASIPRAAGPVLAAIAREAGATALLGLVSGGRLTIVAKEESSTGIGVTIRVGHRYPLEWGAHGKIFSGVEVGWREAGFASDFGGMQRGINAVAAPLRGPGGAVFACLLVVGTFPPEEAALIGGMAVRGAGSLEETLRYSVRGEV